MVLLGVRERKDVYCLAGKVQVVMCCDKSMVSNVFVLSRITRGSLCESGGIGRVVKQKLSVRSHILNTLETRQDCPESVEISKHEGYDSEQPNVTLLIEHASIFFVNQRHTTPPPTMSAEDKAKETAVAAEKNFIGYAKAWGGMSCRCSLFPPPSSRFLLLLPNPHPTQPPIQLHRAN